MKLCVWLQKLEGLTTERQSKVYLKDTGPGSHHIGPLKIVCQIGEIDILCTTKGIKQVDVSLVKWTSCTLVTAFQERCNWDEEDPGTDDLNDQSNEGIAIWRTD